MRASGEEESMVGLSLSRRELRKWEEVGVPAKAVPPSTAVGKMERGRQEKGM